MTFRARIYPHHAKFNSELASLAYCVNLSSGSLLMSFFHKKALKLLLENGRINWLRQITIKACSQNLFSVSAWHMR